jgi:hypothetical protein
VSVASGLLDEDHLVDADVAHLAQVARRVRGCADATREQLALRVGRCDAPLDAVGRAARLELAPQVGAPWHLVVRHQRVQCVAEELEALLPAPDRLGAVLVQGEAGDERDVGVDRVAERHAFLATDDVVVHVDPRLRLVGIDEAERQRTDPVAGGDLDRVAVGARHPHRRVRLLARLGQHVATRHRERLGRVARIRVEHHHVGDLLGGLQRHRSLLLGRDVEAVQLQACRPLADAEVDPTIGDQVERGQALGGARRVVVLRDDLADAVAQPDPRRAGGRRGEEHLRRGRVRVLVEEVVLDLPRIIEAEPIGELDLIEGIAQETELVVVAPRLGKLVLVEDAELHDSSSAEPSRPLRVRRARADSHHRSTAGGSAVTMGR